jgi:hypothetical protein
METDLYWQNLGGGYDSAAIRPEGTTQQPEGGATKVALSNY